MYTVAGIVWRIGRLRADDSILQGEEEGVANLVNCLCPDARCVQIGCANVVCCRGCDQKSSCTGARTSAPSHLPTASTRAQRSLTPGQSQDSQASQYFSTIHLSLVQLPSSVLELRTLANWDELDHRLHTRRFFGRRRPEDDGVVFSLENDRARRRKRMNEQGGWFALARR